MLTERSNHRFMGLDFSNLLQNEVIAEIKKLSVGQIFSYVVTPNVDHVIMLHEAEDDDIRMRFNEAYHGAKLRICDSRILQLLASLRGLKLEVVTGSDLVQRLFEEGHLVGAKVAIIGGDQMMLPELRNKYGGIDLVQHIPPMGVLKNPNSISAIKSFLEKNPSNYVLFALGAPQSEIIARQCQVGGRMQGVALCIGASIEFILNRKARAPAWMQRMRLEWLFRLVSEPRRLWRRYLMIGPRIFVLFFHHKYSP